MGDKTGIQWTATENADGTTTAGATWNPIVGCDHVSAGCDHCYAATTHNRRYLAWKRGTWSNAPVQYHKPFWTGPGHVQLMPERLELPLHWRKPRRVFVNSMSDLFHEDVPLDFIRQVWMTMWRTPQHTYQILSKRPERMRWALDQMYGPLGGGKVSGKPPLPNVWLGVSVENQDAADERIPLLLETPAAVRFLSCEPLLGPVDLTTIPYRGDTDYYLDALKGRYRTSRADTGGTPFCFGLAPMQRLSWVIIGGESGAQARPMEHEWAWSIVQACAYTGVRSFVKQMGTVWAKAHHSKDAHGGIPEEWPIGLRVREWPEVAAAPTATT